MSAAWTSSAGLRSSRLHPFIFVSLIVAFVVLATGINTKATDINGRNGHQRLQRDGDTPTLALVSMHSRNGRSVLQTVAIVPNLEMVLAHNAVEPRITTEMQHQADLHARCAEVAEQLG